MLITMVIMLAVLAGIAVLICGRRFGRRWLTITEVKEYLPLFAVQVLVSAHFIGHWHYNGTYVAAMVQCVVLTLLVFVPMAVFFHRKKMKIHRLWVLLVAAVLIIASVITCWPPAPAPTEPQATESESQPEPESESESEPESEPQSEPESEPQSEETQVVFYNLDLQDDGDAENDFNFGYDRYAAAEAAFLASGKTEGRQEFELAWILKDFKETIETDPAAATAIIGYADAVLGTRMLGFFKNETNSWDKALNDAKVSFVENAEDWRLSTVAFEGLIDNMCTAQIVEISKDDKLEDQMYMFPYTTDFAYGPDVIVMKSDAVGHILQLTFEATKAKKLVLAYRLECGYQPVNVEKAMGIKPVTIEELTGKATGTTGKPTGTTGKATGTTGKPGKEEHTGEPNCDPADSTLRTSENGGPGDTKGSGPDTNNGVGSMISAAEEPGASNTLNSYEEYKKKVQEIKQQAEDATKAPELEPETEKAADGTDVNVDEAPAGEIESPAETQQVATDATTGNPINSSAGGAMPEPE